MPAIGRSIAFLLFLLAVPRVHGQVPGIIDTHAHFELGQRSYELAIDAALGRMDRVGFSRGIFMPNPSPPKARGTYEIEAYSFARQKYDGRVLIGGGGGSLNHMLHETAADSVSDGVKKSFRARADEIAAAGAVVFGEIALHHLSLTAMGPNHGYEYVSPDHPLMLLLADIAAEKNMVIDVHMDLVPQDMKLPERPGVFNPQTPSLLKANQAAFETLLAHNRGARFVWAHAGSDPLGTRAPLLQGQLLTRHPNLFMSLRFPPMGTPAPPNILGPDMKVKQGWLTLLNAFPDRFVIGTDTFHTLTAATQRAASEQTLENYRSVLAQLPPELAEAIAYRNAEKIYRLKN